MKNEDIFLTDRFPRCAKYNPDWILGCLSSGTNWLFLAEWLAEALQLRPGMRVLDIGCGRAASSIFLAREFDVQVWAADLWFSPTENFQRARDAGQADKVFPIRADARSLPFAAEFFDVITSIDSFAYFGTDDMSLENLVRLLKPGGHIGIAGAGLTRDFNGTVPEHLKEWFAQDQGWCFHSAQWWRHHWEKTGFVEVELADTLPDGWQWWLQWHQKIAPENRVEIAAVERDGGSHLGYTRVVGRRRSEAKLSEPVLSIPYEYSRQKLLRDAGEHRTDGGRYSSEAR